jgi:UDP-glucose 6-dehydrogenase
MTSDQVAEIIVLLGPIAGPMFVIWYLLRDSGGGRTREDPATKIMAKLDAIHADVKAIDKRHDDMTNRISRIDGQLSK